MTIDKLRSTPPNVHALDEEDAAKRRLGAQDLGDHRVVGWLLEGPIPLLCIV